MGDKIQYDESSQKDLVSAMKDVRGSFNEIQTGIEDLKTRVQSELKGEASEALIQALEAKEELIKRKSSSWLATINNAGAIGEVLKKKDKELSKGLE